MWRTTSADAHQEHAGQAVPAVLGTRGLLLVWAPLVAVVTVMSAVCLLCNAPPSPLRSAMEQHAGAVLGSWYGRGLESLYGQQQNPTVPPRRPGTPEPRRTAPRSSGTMGACPDASPPAQPEPTAGPGAPRDKAAAGSAAPPIRRLPAPVAAPPTGSAADGSTGEARRQAPLRS